MKAASINRLADLIDRERGWFNQESEGILFRMDIPNEQEKLWIVDGLRMLAKSCDKTERELLIHGN